MVAREGPGAGLLERDAAVSVSVVCIFISHLSHRHQVLHTYTGARHYYNHHNEGSLAQSRPFLCLPPASMSNQATAALEQDDDDDRQANTPTNSDSSPHTQDQTPYFTSWKHGSYQKRCFLPGSSPRRRGQCFRATTRPHLPLPAAEASVLELHAATTDDAHAATYGEGRS